MSRILIVDTCYPDFLKSLPFDPSSTYEAELRKVLDHSFGTADFYSRSLRELGWDAIDVIANHDKLQEMWGRDHDSIPPILLAQIFKYQPNVLFMQDLSFDLLVDKTILAGQLSCPWPGDEKVRQFDVLFTSFPHYIKRIEALGVKAVYNPLAFDEIVLERANIVEITAPSDTWRSYARRFTERPHDVVFIGGVGAPSHWRYGMQVLHAVAETIPTFKWWGYGADLLPDGPLKQKYQGEAWGLGMYEILLQSKIVLNRHGEVAEGFANNMRMFEATGCGAMLLTEEKTNIRDFFAEDECVVYGSPSEAVDAIRYFLEHDEERTAIAANGQKRTLRDHTYAQRMKTVSDTLMGMLDGGSLNESRNLA